MNNWIGPAVKHVRKMPCMCCIFLGVWRKRNSFPLVPIQPSSPTTKELHAVWPDGELIFQHLAIYFNETSTIAYKICHINLRFSHIVNKPSKKLPKTLKILPKWRNFAKSGHTGWMTYLVIGGREDAEEVLFVVPVFSSCRISRPKCTPSTFNNKSNLVFSVWDTKNILGIQGINVIYEITLTVRGKITVAAGLLFSFIGFTT